MRKYWLVLMFLSGILVGCNRQRPADGKMIFRYNEASGITSLDPLKAGNLANIWMVQQLYCGLVQLDSTLQVQPCIARRWEINDSGLTYIFYLRDDVYFHESACFPDGKRTVTAPDFVYSLQRLHRQSGPQWVLSQVDENSDGSKKIEAPDDTTFVIHLKTAYAQFLQVLTMPYCYVLPHEAVEYYGDDFGRNPVGAGPFRFVRWYEGEKLVLNKNPDYFEKDREGHRLPYLDGISVTFIKDKQTAFLEFLEGRNDLLSGLDASYKNELLTPEGVLNPRYASLAYLQKLPYLNTEYLGIQLEQSAGSVFSGQDFRKALSLAVNRRKLITYIRNGIGRPALLHFVPPVLLGGEDAATQLSDLERKKAVDSLLNAAGYKGEKITLNTDVAYVDIATALANQWQEAGIQAGIEVMDRPTLKSQVAKGQLMFFRASWIADYPDAENYLSLFCTGNFSPAGPNYTHFSSTAFDSLYALSMRQTEVGERMLTYRQMDSLVMAEIPVIPLFFDEVTRFVRKEISGLPPHPMNHLDLKRVRKSIREN